MASLDQQVKLLAERTRREWKRTKIQGDTYEKKFTKGTLKSAPLPKYYAKYCEYDLNELSVHGAEDVEDYVTFDIPYDTSNNEFLQLKSSPLGFIGTISGDNGEFLNRWIRTKTTSKEQRTSAEDSNYVTYSKVFPSKSGSQEPRPNSTEKPWFHWQRAIDAWSKTKSKEEVEISLRRSCEAKEEPPKFATGYFTIYRFEDYHPLKGTMF